jgi:hypothetical protein
LAQIGSSSLDETEKIRKSKLGTWKLGPDSTAVLEISTVATNGYVVADGVQLLLVNP